ncbi:hypothetical protein [Erwinia phage FBB1]|nr:hypothetical protein [Erwinia phage FBB1]
MKILIFVILEVAFGIFLYNVLSMSIGLTLLCLALVAIIVYFLSKGDDDDGTGSAVAPMSTALFVA